MNDYIIIESTNKRLFLEYVERKLNNGYICQGGVNVSNEQYFQAMVKQ